jgi:hypothetical protein
VIWNNDQGQRETRCGRSAIIDANSGDVQVVGGYYTLDTGTASFLGEN